MRILWMGHNLAYPPKGGPLQRNYNLLREAGKQHEVHALLFDQPASRPPGVTPQDCVAALRKFCASVQWVPLSKDSLGLGRYGRALAGMLTGDPYEFRWLRSKSMMSCVQRLAVGNHFDVVHADTLGLAPYARFFPAAGTVLNHHDIESALVQRRAHSEKNAVWRIFWAREAANLLTAERRWCPLFHVNMVVSGDEAEIVKSSCGQSKICIVPNGVDVEYFTPRPDPGGKRLLFCGRLDQLANRGAITYFFKSIWPGLLDKEQDLEIDVVGKNPPGWLLELSQRDLRVHVPGFVDDVRPYFQRSTVFICPISEGGGTRLKILDALAMGMPVVSTTFAASGLSLSHGKHLRIADTAEEFSAEIIQLLSKQALRQELSQAGRNFVESNYSWSVVGESLLTAYTIAAAAGIETSSSSRT